ncbi:hypothetical protein GCM10017687_58570 [Streptomyces echinatus]
MAQRPLPLGAVSRLAERRPVLVSLAAVRNHSGVEAGTERVCTGPDQGNRVNAVAGRDGGGDTERRALLRRSPKVASWRKVLDNARRDSERAQAG